MGLVRLLLALSVVLGHAGGYHGLVLVGGRVAVEGFFIISGFYMALVLSEKYDSIASRSQRLRTFYTARILRLYPTYAVVVVLTLIVDGVLRRRWEHLLAVRGGAFGIGGLLLLIGTNLVIVGQDAVVFLGAHAHGGLFVPHSLAVSPRPLWTFLVVPQAWSLSLELGFYLLAPWLVRRRTRVVAGMAVASVACRAVLVYAGLSGDPWSYRFFPNELVFFFVGVLGYRLNVRYRRRRRRSLEVGALGALVVTMAAMSYVHVPLKQGVFFILLAVSVPCVFELTKRSRLDRVIGDLSYPLYICHLAVLRQFWVHHSDGALKATGVSLAVAAALLLFVDRPVDRLRQRRVARAIPPTGIPDIAPATP